MLRRSDRTIVFLIFLIALGVRLVGIKHGFPYIFHPDEPAIIRSALGIRFFPNPGHFDWPHLFMYFNYFVYMGFAYFRDLLVTLDLKDLFSAQFPLMWNDEVIFYYLTRVISAFFGALTIIPIYMTGKRIFSGQAGILAAFAFALIPFHVQHSHYALPDMPMVFFIACGMYFASKVLFLNEPNNYAASGFYVGLAASSKYNGGLSALMVPIAHVIRIIKNKHEELIDIKGFSNLVISGIMAVLGFLLGTPFSVLDHRTFLSDDSPNGALWQFTNVGSIENSQRIAKFVNDMAFKISDDLGYVILAVYFVTIIYLVVKTLMRKAKEEELDLWFLVLPSLFMLLYVAGFAKSRSHYYLIAYPYIAVVFGYFTSKIYSILESRLRYLSIIGLFGAFLIPAFMTFSVSFKYHNGDTRNILDNWLTQNVDSGSSVVFTDNDLKVIFEDKGYIELKGYDKLTGVTSGYLLVSYDKVLDTKADDYTLYLDKLEKVETISSKDRLGPDIEIYRIIR